MTRVIFSLAFFLGAITVAWMGWVFAGSDALAFTVTGIIGIVYFIGLAELVHFRKVTGTLTHALGGIPKRMAHLSEWLYRIDPALQNAVRLRIEGERVGLPAPVLTPYLVGLLVMLGLLGTFLGLVDTLKGAVIALEGTTDLQAIRAGLVAPIKGLEVAFGTSVAGVAASAMLGLMSTLSRRERMLATRELDAKTANEFREFSGAHHRQLSHKAMQVQAQVLPELTQSFQNIGTKMEQMLEALGDKLISGQTQFHESAKNNYTALAESVDKTLRDAIVESGRRAGESIEPIVAEVMGGIRTETQNTHEGLAATLQKQFDVLSRSFTDTSQGIANTWKMGLTEQSRASDALMKHMNESHKILTKQFHDVSASLMNTFENLAAEMMAQQTQGDQARIKVWEDAFEQAQQQASESLITVSTTLTAELNTLCQAQQSTVSTVIEDFQGMASQLSGELSQAGESALAHQKTTMTALETAADTLAGQAARTTDKILEDVQQLVHSAESLIDARLETESNWLAGHEARMADLSTVVKTQLEALRDAEALRGEAAVARLAELEGALVTHLSTLGEALEAPMTRLIETASETPRAAAEVIAQLREEISNNITRDNTHLEERRQIMETLSALSTALTDSTHAQRDAIESLVQGTTQTLTHVGDQFSEKVDSESTKLAEASDQVVGSALEIASLGEGFGLGVEQFGNANEKLIEHLNQLEQTLQQSNERSAEQLGYYVAQAREIIDYSISAQQSLVDEVRQMPEQASPEAAEVE